MMVTFSVVCTEERREPVSVHIERKMDLINCLAPKKRKYLRQEQNELDLKINVLPHYLP